MTTKTNGAAISTPSAPKSSPNSAPKLAPVSNLIQEILPPEPTNAELKEAETMQTQLQKLQEQLHTLGFIGIPDYAILYAASDIETAYKSHMQCKGCSHLPDKIPHCYAYSLTYDAQRSRLSLAASNCPYAKALAQQKRYEAGYQKLMIVPRFAERTLRNFVPSPVTQRIYQYCLSFVANYQEHQKGLYFYGGYGSGKTHLAVGILRALYETKHVAGTFLVTSSFFDQLKASFGDGKKFAETFQFAANAPLLVLDDLGEGRKDRNGMLSEWTREELFLLVNSRYEKKLTTIFTSKYGIEQIAEITGKAIASRLMEMCVFVHNRAGDYRAKNYQVIE